MFALGNRSAAILRNPRNRRRTRQEYLVNTPRLQFVPHNWFIVPKHTAPDIIYSMLNMIPYGLTQALYWIQHDLPNYIQPFPETHFRPDVPSYGLFGKDIGPIQRTFSRLTRENQRLRWAFKRLLTLWLGKRLRPANTEDPVSLEAPAEPIRITDWTARRYYLFEAKTLLRDIRTKLYLNDQLFPTPQPPKNPFTNSPLTLAQTIHVTNSLRRLGYTDWAIESYRVSGFNLATFKARFQYYLKIRALNTVFQRPTEDDCVDLLFDFIHEQYTAADMRMPRTDIWLWFMRNRPENPRVYAWRKWCEAYYRAQIEQPMNYEELILPGILLEVEALVQSPISQMIVEYKYRDIGRTNIPLSN